MADGAAKAAEPGRAAHDGARHRLALLHALALPLALPLWAALAVALPASAQEAGPRDAPDFSHVATKAAARKLVREGRLVEIALFPTELGGADGPHNLSFITPEAAAARDRVIGTLGRFFEDGLIDQLRVVPHYQDRSIVPRSIAMTTTHSERDGALTLTIEIW